MSKGEKFRVEAESTLQSATGFSFATVFGFGKTTKFDEAAELYTKAGNAFKLENKWQEAGEMFMKASDCHQKADSQSESITALVNAANAFRKISPLLAVDPYLKAIEKYNEAGRFGQSAKYYQEVAELYEGENNSEKAAEYYNSAADMFVNENKPLSAQPCYLKIANILAKNKKYTNAADIFEKVGHESLQSRLGAFSAKNYFFQALICYLAAGDSVGTNMKLATFKSADHNFPSSRECAFIEKLTEAIKSNDGEQYAQACFEFDRISPLDAWKTEMLLEAKKHIIDDEDVDIS